jgi:hypothetical protein
VQELLSVSSTLFETLMTVKLVAQMFQILTFAAALLTG